MIHKIIKTLVVMLGINSLGQAEPVTGISRYGTPALAEGFAHIPGVNPDAPQGGEGRFSALGTFDSLNPLIIKGTPAEGLALTRDSLMRRAAGEPFTLYALIAQRVDIAPDFSKMTISLNPQARFHDGTPITAQDVKFTVELLREKGVPRYRHYFSQTTMRVQDKNTLIVHFAPQETGHYDPERPLIFLLVPILSEANLKNVDFANSGLMKILGSGPYRIKQVIPGRSIVYEKVPNYWAQSLPINKGQYNFALIKIDYYKNVTAQFQGFLAGDYDYYSDPDPTHWEIAYKNVPAVKDGRIKLYQVAHSRPVTVRTIIFNLRRPYLQDFNLRQALAYAFDGDTINRLLYHQRFAKPTSLFANTILAHRGTAAGKERKILEHYKIAEDIINHPYIPPATKGDGDQRQNLTIAARLLKKAGWVIKQGKLTKNLGKGKHSPPLLLEFLLKDPKLEKIALSFKESLAKLGIQLVVRLVDSTQYESRVATRDFDMIIHSWSNSLAPGLEQGYYFSHQTADVEGSTNYIGVKDPVVEALANAINLSKDYDDLIACVRALDRVVMHRVYMIPLFYDPFWRFAMWTQRIAQPKVDPQIGVNIMTYGWAVHP